MIASVAGFNPSEIRRVGRESYALTLWAFLHKQDAQRLESLTSEHDRISLAEMVAVGYHDPKKLRNFDLIWRNKAIGSAVTRTREEMERDADSLFQQHAQAMAKRPVS